MFFQINEDLAELNQCCNHSHQSMDVVEETQTGMMEQVVALVRRVDTLEAHNGEQHLCISKFEWKVEQGEETLEVCQGLGDGLI